MSVAELEITATKGARLLEHFGPGRDCQTLVPADIDQYVDARRRDGIADATIRKEIGKLVEALRVAKRVGRYEGEPLALRPAVLQPDKPRSRWLEPAQFVALLSELPAHRAEYVLVWCHTGVRYGELHRIEAQHVDHDGRRLWVPGRKGDQEYRERWVPLSEAAYDVLSARVELCPSGPVFPRWHKPNVRLTLARACRRLGIEPVTPNDLRRTYVSWHLHLGTSELEVQRYAGHSPRSPLVRRVYGQLSPSAGRLAVERFPVSQTVSQTGAAIVGIDATPRTADEHDLRRPQRNLNPRLRRESPGTRSGLAARNSKKRNDGGKLGGAA